MQHKLITQYHLFLLALSFLTRIPVHLNGEIQPHMLSQASRYFALVGAIIGSILAFVFWGLQLIFPLSIAVLLTMAMSLILTGAFHEDGWADVWDGFGGGWSIEQKLNIMKDSRLGTYGASALFIILLLKYQSLLLLANDISLILYVIVLANVISRAIATSLIYTMNYVQEDSVSKVKPIAMQLSNTSLFILISTSALVLLIGIVIGLVTGLQVVILLLVLFFIRSVLRLWFQQQLSGYTGDCLGAAQVLSELVVYFTFIVLGTINVS